MADLLPIRAFSGGKGSESQKVNTAPEMRAGSASRFAAIDYARELAKAPDGSRITSTEKNLLMVLAQLFNSDLGVAWPSIKKMAKQACISERHCQRTIVNLERKKIIQRIHMRREDLGGQTSNEYYFPALGTPLKTRQTQELRLQLQKVPRTPMTGRPGRRGPGPADTSVRPPRTSMTGGPGHGCPPIESLGETSKNNQNDSAREALVIAPGCAGKPRHSETQNTFPNKANAAFSEMGLARMAWKSAVERVRADKGAREVRSCRFHDVIPVSAEEGSAGNISLTLRSPDPEKATIGIAKHEIAIAQALRSFYGRTVKLRVIGYEPSNVPASRPAPSAN